MSFLKHGCLASSAFVVLLLLSGCEQTISIGSTVHADGSLDRTIVLHETDSAKAGQNIMGISEATGWGILIEPDNRDAETDEKPKVNITFRKHFASAEDANREMNGKGDTVFHIASTFQKENRWFYTYIEYRDTYRSLNSFNAIPKEDYFTREDFAFIDRLPPEGKPISNADSLYLARLNEKIFDVYGMRTIFEEIYGHLVSSMRGHDVAQQWQDSLAGKKEQIYKAFVREDGDFLTVFDNADIPVPEPVRESTRKKIAELEKRWDFISDAYSGKYIHTIKMPWQVVASNADSATSNELFWRPPVVKFLLSDYTMSARSRKMNIWAVVASGVAVCVTIGLFFYRRRRDNAHKSKRV